jgi:hypothetical protein
MLSVELAKNAVCLQVIVKVSKRVSLEPNRKGYYHRMNNTIKAWERNYNPTTAREIYEDRAPERNLPWVANIMGI